MQFQRDRVRHGGDGRAWDSSRNRKLAGHILIHMQEAGSAGRGGRGVPSETPPSDTLPPAKLHLLKVP